jgi:hypothetical protein
MAKLKRGWASRSQKSDKIKFSSKRKLREHITGTTSKSGDPFSKKTKPGSSRRSDLSKQMKSYRSVKNRTKGSTQSAYKGSVQSYGTKKVK